MNDRVKSVLMPLATFVVLVAAWDASIRWFKVPSYLLPTPQSVLDALWTGYVGGAYWPHLGTTVYQMVVGYLIGCSVAVVLGAIVAESRTVERFIYPYVIAFQSMPKVAFAPLLIVWLGFGPASKIVLVALICFFPVFINCVVGLRSANPDLLRLYRAFGASRLHVFLNVKLPSAASTVFAGLQIAIVMALIGAVVGEFIAAKQGLGYLIQSSTLSFDVSTMFAAILSLACIGVVGSTLIRILHRRIVFWEARATQTETAREGG